MVVLPYEPGGDNFSATLHVRVDANEQTSDLLPVSTRAEDSLANLDRRTIRGL
jgi:hypothetical protein